MRKAVFAILFALICAFSAHAEQDAPAPRYLTVWRYIGKKDFTKANIMNLKWNGQRFVFDSVGEIGAREYVNPNVPCKSLLTYNQSFPLSLYTDREYLSQEQADFQRAVEGTVSPERVTFTEISDVVEASKENFEASVPKAQRGKALQSILKLPALKMSEKKRSSMWMIAGQTLGADHSKLEPHNLPWQDDPGLKDDSRLRIDRKKFKVIFEFGRAGQVGGRSIDQNLRTLTLLAYQEMRHLQPVSGVSDGYIFVHSLDPARTRLFEGFYGAHRYPANWENDANCVLYMPISEALQHLRPARLAERVDQLMQLSGGVIDDLQALEILDMNLKFFRNDVDFDKDPSAPVIVEDMSLSGYKALMMSALAHFGIAPANAQRMFRKLSMSIYNDQPDQPYYRDNARLYLQFQKLAKFNAVQISNLNDSLAKNDKDYLPSVLRGVYDYYIQRFTEFGVRDAALGLEAKQIRFAVRTANPNVSRLLKKLKPAETQEFAALGGGTAFVHVFSLDQIRKMTGSRVYEGYWTSRRLLHHPLQF